MSVIFVQKTLLETKQPPSVYTLFGEPFPPEDVKAYWHMVPDDACIYVEWSTALSVFFVSRYDYGGDNDDPHVVRKQIMAREATKLSVWMRVISDLVNGNAA
jgi:hypothetical protein